MPNLGRLNDNPERVGEPLGREILRGHHDLHWLLSSFDTSTLGVPAGSAKRDRGRFISSDQNHTLAIV
jgi:hypothetical protein